MEYINVIIKNWETYNSRPDVKRPSWFRFEHGFFDSSQFYGWKPIERIVWLYILCEASKQTKPNQKVVRINVTHATAVTTAKAQDVNRTVQKLKELQILEVRTAAGRWVTSRENHATDERTNKTDETRQDERDETNEEEPSGGQATAPPSPTQIFIGTYVKAFQTKYPGGRPDLGGKVQGGIKRLLRETPLERACAMIQVFMQMDDPWFKTKGHDFGTFEQNLTKVGVALDTGQSGGMAQWEREVLAEEAKRNGTQRLSDSGAATQKLLWGETLPPGASADFVARSHDSGGEMDGEDG